MNALDEVIDYLIDKTKQRGARSLGTTYLQENYTNEDIPRLVDIAFQTIQMQFTKTTPDTPAGEAKLTGVSSWIGQQVCPKDPNLGIFTQWELQVRVGDLFVEAFYQCEFVDLYYPQIRDGWHIITATRKWTELADIDTETIAHVLRGTVTHKPEKISGMMQMHTHKEEPVMKGKSENDKLNVEAKWINAIDKLQQTSWKINDRILQAMLQNEDTFISREEIEYKKKQSPEHKKELKRRSKIVEWAFITKKAKHLQDKPFYQFVETDYRGRIYYSESFLCFQGSDFSRGLMKFARGKPMDQHGLFWLAVHTACSYNQSYDINEIPEWCQADYKA